MEQSNPNIAKAQYLEENLEENLEEKNFPMDAWKHWYGDFSYDIINRAEN